MRTTQPCVLGGTVPLRHGPPAPPRVAQLTPRQTRPCRALSTAAAGSPPGSSATAPDDGTPPWSGHAFPSPSYLQTDPLAACESCSGAPAGELADPDCIRKAEAAVPGGSAAPADNRSGQAAAASTSGRLADADCDHTAGVWLAIRREAERDAASEPMLSSLLQASILAHDCLERSLAYVLADRLASPVMPAMQLFEVFYQELRRDPNAKMDVVADLRACKARDPACLGYSQSLLYFKGFHALQAHRVAHSLWNRGQRLLALALQSRVSEVFAVDIHPAAKLGQGILLDHGTGIVIGETAVVGNNVSMLQNVTLGGTGKGVGDRHPKISDNVLVGASTTILGNIRIGRGAQIAAGSLVLKPVEPHTMVAGSPAKVVGHVHGNPAMIMEHNPGMIIEHKKVKHAHQAGAAASNGNGAAAAGAKAGAARKSPPRPKSPQTADYMI